MSTATCSLKPLLSSEACTQPIDWDKEFSRRGSLDVEIGFGLGETLIAMAHQYPERNFVGIEVIWERIYKTLKAIDRQGHSCQEPPSLSNIRILRLDAWVAFERLFHPQSIDKIYCLFPCPWPKKKHIKNRLFSSQFFRLLNSRLKKKGEVKIITDFLPFLEWLLEQVPGTGFHFQAKTVAPSYNTKFERKWSEGGQKEFFQIDLIKTKSIDIPLKEGVALKTYWLNDFSPEEFRFNNSVGDISIIFKDILYDAKQKKAMVHLIVAEENLTQHFWAAIIKRQKRWCVCRAEGQNFFPTPGIVQALKLVHEAARQTNA